MNSIKDLLSPEVCRLITEARLNLPPSADDAFNYILDLSEAAVEFDEEEQEKIKGIILEKFEDRDFIFSQILIAAAITVLRDEIIPDNEYLGALLSPQKYIRSLDNVEKIKRVLEYADSGEAAVRRDSDFGKMLQLIEKHVQDKMGMEMKKMSLRIEKLEKSVPSPAPAIPPVVPPPVVPECNSRGTNDWIFGGIVFFTAFTASLAAMVTVLKTNSPIIFMLLGGCLAAGCYYYQGRLKRIN